MKKLLLALTLIFTVFSLFACSDGSLSKTEINLYFGNLNKTELASEKRKIEFSGNELYKTAVQELINGTKSKEHSSLIAKKTKINSVAVENGIVNVDFSSDIYSGIETDNLLIRMSILKTLTQFSGVNGVKLTVNSKPYLNSKGNEVGIIYANDIVYDTEPAYVNSKYVLLYFKDKNKDKLVLEKRSISVSEKESMEMRILKELQKGPVDENLLKTFPDETKILSVETKEGVCFVNLSPEFISKHIQENNSENLAIYSIVNSLTELEGINKVQFLIDGQKTETFYSVSFNEPFSRNESVIK